MSNPNAEVAPRTVLIFAHACAPYHRATSMVGAQRPAQFAKHLPSFGWRAIVLCCDGREPAARDATNIGESVRAVLRNAGPNESVIIPTPALPHHGVLDRTWRALAPTGNGRDKARLALRRPVTMLKQLMAGDESWSWQPVAREAAMAVASEVRVDACIGEHSPDAGMMLGRWYSDRFGVPWIADFRDPVLQPFNATLRALYRPVVRRIVSTASYTVGVGDYFAKLDHELFGRPSLAISNGFDPEEFAGLSHDGDPSRFVVAYGGNMWTEQRLDIFLDGLVALRDRTEPELFASLRFLYIGGWHEVVRALVAARGLEGVADIRARVPRDEAFARMAAAEELLVLSIADPERCDIYLRRGIQPAKTFEYFGLRRPIICVPGDRAMLEELLSETRTGTVLRTPSEIAEHLESALRQWRAGQRPPYAPDGGAVARYTRRVLTGRLAEALDAMVDARAARPASPEPSLSAGSARGGGR